MRAINRTFVTAVMTKPLSTLQIVPNMEPNLRASCNVVACLSRVLPVRTNHILYVHNWFKSIPQNVYMFERGIQMVGTVHRLSPIWKESSHFTEHLSKINDVTVSVVSWFDNKIVTFQLCWHSTQHKSLSSNRQICNQHISGVYHFVSS